MTLPELAYLIVSLNHLVDNGFDATIAEVQAHVAGGSLFEWLRRRFDGHIDLSIWDFYGRTTEDDIENALLDILVNHRGNERRKFGVSNNGICLLIAWLAELVQRRAWKDEPANMELSQ